VRLFHFPLNYVVKFPLNYVVKFAADLGAEATEVCKSFCYTSYSSRKLFRAKYYEGY